jgi:hypothetical protein
MGLLTFEELASNDLAKTEATDRGSARLVLAEVGRTPLDRQFDIFLSHCSLDAPIVLRLLETIQAHGFSAYVDWIDDRTLDRSKVTHRTAGILRQRMQKCTCLLYAFSNNAGRSAWMPWELGFFDGLKGRAAILPIVKAPGSNAYSGREYLGIYPYITKSKNLSGESRLCVRRSTNIFVGFRAWLGGKEPRMHPRPLHK